VLDKQSTQSIGQPFDFSCLASIAINSPAGAAMSVKKSKVSDPQHLRRRAKEARTLADELTDPEAKRKMLKIAEEYETLAIRAVQRLRHHSSATIRNWRR
jgi:hypothetical protein